MATSNENPVLACCGAQEHPWETFSVATKWSPETLRCLIIGESPGEVAAKYFYNEDRKVAVRTIMLRELHRHGVLSEPSLPAFRKAGFLFDHAIRCLLPRTSFSTRRVLRTVTSLSGPALQRTWDRSCGGGP